MPPTTLRILSVEDEELNRVLLRAVLKRAEDPRLRDAELIEATSVEEGRQRLAEARADLVLLDRRLPDGDGLDLAREAQASGSGHPPFVAVTADAVPATHSAAAAAGCAAMVVKPYLPAELTAVLASVLDASRRGEQTDRS